MMRAAYYVTATGQIIETRDWPDGTPSTDIDDRVFAGMAYAIDPLDEVTPSTHYYPGGVKTPRPVLYYDDDIIVDADGVINVSFALPNGTEVVAAGDGTDYVSAGGESFQFKTVKLGEWTYNFVPPFPYLPLELRISASAF
jgi:hypothetical protein